VVRRFEWKGKNVLVSGGASGIGLALAGLLAERGAVPLLVDRNPDALAKALRQLQGRGLAAHGFPADVTDIAALRELRRELRESGLSPHVLVNCAGVTLVAHVSATDLEEWSRIIGVNLMGTVNVVETFLPDLLERGAGHIVNIGSTITAITPPTGGPYTVAKAGLEALTRVVAAEETGKGIHINCLAPGLVDTDMGRKLMHVNDLSVLAPQMPFGRVCRPEDVANAMLFLIAEEGSYIQGQVIHINGGRKQI
jgi:NAD(P)-dependent dehydrogenase (short-subunit alcohol dehydrogenase family)